MNAVTDIIRNYKVHGTEKTSKDVATRENESSAGSEGRCRWETKRPGKHPKTFKLSYKVKVHYTT